MSFTGWAVRWLHARVWRGGGRGGCARGGGNSLSLDDITAIVALVFPAATASTSARSPVGTVVRLADGVAADGPLRAGQLAMLVADDGSSGSPYRVRTANGVERQEWILLASLVAAGETEAVRCRGGGGREIYITSLREECYTSDMGRVLYFR